MMSTLQDYHNTDDDNWNYSTNTRWLAQTFTAGNSYSINSVKLKLFRTNSPGIVTVSIRAVDGDGKPTGADLASGTTDGDTLTTSNSGEWREITFSATYSIVVSTLYAIVIRSSQPLSAQLDWRQSTNNEFAGGRHNSSNDSGSSWTLSSTALDVLFETYNDYTFTPPATGPDITRVKRLVAAAQNSIFYESI